MMDVDSFVFGSTVHVNPICENFSKAVPVFLVKFLQIVTKTQHTIAHNHVFARTFLYLDREYIITLTRQRIRTTSICVNQHTCCSGRLL